MAEEEGQGSGASSGEPGTENETVPTSGARNDGKTPEQRVADMEKALRVANKEAETHRRKAKELEDRYATDAEKALKEQVAAATQETEAKWRPRVVKAEARNALREAGAGSAAVSRLLNLIDVSAAEVDDDGNVTGLDTQVTAIKKEWPELFVEKTAGKNGGPSGRAVGAADKGSGGKEGGPARSADKIAAALFGG